MNEFERNCLNYLAERINDCPRDIVFENTNDMVSRCFIRDLQNGFLPCEENKDVLDWYIEFWGYLGSEYEYYLSDLEYDSEIINPFSDPHYFMIKIVIQVCANYLMSNIEDCSSWKNFVLTEDKLSHIKEVIQ